MNNRLKKYLLLALSLILFGTLPIVASSKAEQWSYPSKDPGLGSFKGSGTSSSPYLIQSAQDLANLAYIVTDANNDVTGKYFKMTRDIYLNDFTVDAEGNITNNGSDLKEWTPIGEWGFFKDDDFQGIFDGGGYTIYGLYMKEKAKRDYVGLFGTTEDAVIKNLTIKNAYISADNENKFFSVGCLVGLCTSSTFINVGVENAYVKCFGTQCTSTKCGGLIGKAQCDVTLNDCYFDGNLITILYNSAYMGGLIGEYTDKYTLKYQVLRINRCHTNGTIQLIKNDSDVGTEKYISGMVGHTDDDSSDARIYITDCVNRANIYVDDIYGESGKQLTSIFATNFSHKAEGITRSANFGNITFVNNRITDSGMYLSTDCKSYNNTVNYGHYILPENRNDSHIYIHAGHNTYSSSSSAKNLFVWKEARPTATLGSKDSYDVKNGTEMSVEELNDKNGIIYQLNKDLRENVWGLINVTEAGKTYLVPCPIACGGELATLYQDDEGQYLISSEADLRFLQQLVKNGTDISNRYYLLTRDINMSSSAPLEPIGDDNHPFTGIFDGGGHVISDVTIKGRALFGSFSGTVKNLGLVNMRFVGGNAVCAPIAYKAGGKADATILNSYVGGNIILGDSANTDNSTTLAGLIYEATGNNVTIKNCYFRGQMANATTVNNQSHVYYGLVGSNSIGKNLTMTDCYANFDFDDNEASGAGLMPDATQASLTNCHYLCSRFSDADGKVTTNGALTACFAGKEGWLTGAYRPVLESACHYTLTDYQGQTVYADAIPMDDDSCRNDIFCHTLTDAEKTGDPLLWALPNVALCDTATNVNYLINCNLHADAPFHYAPPTGSTTKGQLHYPLTFTADSPIRLMCLPATLHMSNLPDGAHLMLMGKTIGNSTDGYSSYTVACDSVPAGVPFLIYMEEAPTDTIDMVLRGDIVSEPQTSGELEGETFYSGLVGTFDTKHLNSGCANIEIDDTDVKLKYATDVDLQPFSAYIDADADVTCTGGVLLNESSNDISEVIDTYQKWKVSVYLVRSLHAGAWNTLCVPFDISDLEIMNKWGSATKVEELTSVTTADGTCTLGFTKTSSIKAGKCYLIKPYKVDRSWYQFENKTLSTDSIPTTLDASDGSFTLTFHGSFARKVLDGSDTSKGTYFTQDNKIYKVAATSTIPMNGFRCWIETSKPNVLNQTKIAHYDGTTSIANVICIGTTKSDNRIYDLQGIEVRQPQRHHIYIKNNRKGLIESLGPAAPHNKRSQD